MIVADVGFMSEAPNLKKLADYPPTRWRGDVACFVKQHQGLIRNALEVEHKWVTIYLAAASDGCPSRNIQSFTRTVKKILGLDAAIDASTKGDLDQPKSRPTVGRSLRNGGLSTLAETRAGIAKQSTSNETIAPIDGATSAEPEAGEFGVKSAPDLDVMAMPRHDDRSARVPATPTAAGRRHGAAEAPAGALHRQYAEARKPPPPRTIDPGSASWDSAAPGQRAMLLKDAE